MLFKFFIVIKITEYLEISADTSLWYSTAFLILTNISVLPGCKIDSDFSFEIFSDRSAGPEELQSLKDQCYPHFPNTYTFSKCVAENILVEKAADLPLAIVRPSIIGCVVKTPVPVSININTRVVHKVRDPIFYRRMDNNIRRDLTTLVCTYPSTHFPFGKLSVMIIMGLTAVTAGDFTRFFGQVYGRPARCASWASVRPDGFWILCALCAHVPTYSYTFLRRFHTVGNDCPKALRFCIQKKNPKDTISYYLSYFCTIFISSFFPIIPIIFLNFLSMFIWFLM